MNLPTASVNQSQTSLLSYIKITILNMHIQRIMSVSKSSVNSGATMAGGKFWHNYVNHIGGGLMNGKRQQVQRCYKYIWFLVICSSSFFAPVSSFLHAYMKIKNTFRLSLQNLKKTDVFTMKNGEYYSNQCSKKSHFLSLSLCSGKVR